MEQEEAGPGWMGLHGPTLPGQLGNLIPGTPMWCCMVRVELEPSLILMVIMRNIITVSTLHDHDKTDE